MLESLVGFIKTLPTWLATVAEILVVAMIFLTAVPSAIVTVVPVGA